MLQVQQALAQLYAKVVGRPGTGSFKSPSLDPTTHLKCPYPKLQYTKPIQCVTSQRKNVKRRIHYASSKHNQRQKYFFLHFIFGSQTQNLVKCRNLFFLSLFTFYILRFNKIVRRDEFLFHNYKTKHLDRKEIHVFE